MKDKLKISVIALVVLSIIAIFGYFMWNVARSINYNLSYKSMVVETIKEHVKEGCLNK